MQESRPSQGGLSQVARPPKSHVYTGGLVNSNNNKKKKRRKGAKRPVHLMFNREPSSAASLYQNLKDRHTLMKNTTYCLGYLEHLFFNPNATIEELWRTSLVHLRTALRPGPMLLRNKKLNKKKNSPLF